uniref:Uncharacterized protein n=1 Tax=Caenorhabditis japonica TaxID=281687 RepID=A0A8R1DPW8_CAEJA
MKLFAALIAALVASGQACFGGSGGSGCCPQAQPACGNPCGGGIGPAAAGPTAYAVAPPSYAQAPPPPPPPQPSYNGAYPTGK